MTNRRRNVLFLCTGNSARSILAESLLNTLGGDRFAAYSAGSFPAGEVNPYALALLDEKGHPLDGLRSKSWIEFGADDAPTLDLIFTVCGNAAREACPVWPGHPVTAHWGVPDPAAVAGSDEQKRHAFAVTYARLERRVRDLLALDLDAMSADQIVSTLGAVGARAEGESDSIDA